MLRIAIAPNAFKGSLSAQAAAEAIQRGLLASALPCETLLLPLADGGDGTLEVLLSQPGTSRHSLQVENPLGETIEAAYGVRGDTAFVEMALASGLALLGERRDALHASSYGTGQLMAHAIAQGQRRILLGVGGSASTDGGAGALQALGLQLLDAQGQPIAGGGAALASLAQVIPNPALAGVEIQVLCDVDNPVIGPAGAAQVFAPQKGATPQEVTLLDANLRHFFSLIAVQTGQDVRELAGGGAAGGIAGGLAALAGAALVPGAATLIDMLGYAEQLATCDLLITGEGALDTQTERGKAPAVIAAMAQQRGIAVIALAGSIPKAPPWNAAKAFDAVFSLVPGVIPLAEAIQQAAPYLENIACQVGNLLALAPGQQH